MGSCLSVEKEDGKVKKCPACDENGVTLRYRPMMHRRDNWTKLSKIG